MHISFWSRLPLAGRLLFAALSLPVLAAACLPVLFAREGEMAGGWAAAAWLLFCLLLLALGGSVLWLWCLLRQEMAGLQQISRATAALLSGDHAVRVEPAGSPELRQAMQQFNDTVAALHAGHEALRHEREQLHETLGNEGLLLEQLRLAASVFEHAHEGIIITERSGRIVEVNPKFTEITGYSREEAVGYRTSLLKSGLHDAAFYQEMWQTLETEGHWQGELWNRRKNGEIYPELLTITSIDDNHGQISHYLGVFSDITLQKEQHQKLEHIAHYDALTGLPNRVLLADRMRVAMAQAERSQHLLGVVYLDLDDFKPVNDQLGHQAGDKLLREIAERLLDSVRGGDTVARIGGDEFVVLLCELTSLEECERAMNRLLRAVGEPVLIGHQTVQVSASLGATLYPSDEGDADVLLRHADQAMYRAKEAGRNRYHLFDPENDRRARSQRDQLTRIEQALESGEFRLYYQPKVNMRLGTIIGFEALIRWQHPERGLLSPATFIPLVEESELAIPLGQWVMQEALAQLARWQQAGMRWILSVNVSPRHLEHPDFVEWLAGCLHHYPDIPPGALELELLETAALQDVERVSVVIEACKRLGVRFALDDFGTGYSSLTYFKRLPAQVLKIDRSFISDMLRDTTDLAIVEGVVGFTRAFQRNVIAEGVENLEQGIMLLHLGCDIAQGHAIARPMPSEQVLDWSRHWQPDPVWSNAASLNWQRCDLPLLTAELEHRRWIEQLEQLLAHPPASGNPPLPELHHCKFRHWLEVEGRERYHHVEEFQTLVALHQTVHQHGQEVVLHHRNHDPDGARAHLQGLQASQQALIEGLQAMQVQMALLAGC